jgi:hypothetical protein
MLNAKTAIPTLLLFLFVSSLYAQEPNASVQNYSVECSVEKGRLTQTTSVVIKINNREGNGYAEIEIPYSKLEPVSNLSAWIEKPDHTKVRDLKRSEIIDKSAISDISLYEDQYKKCFNLNYNEYPYLICYTYTSVSKNFLSIADWSPVLYNDIPTLTARLKVTIPKDLAVSCITQDAIRQKNDTTPANNIVMRWTSDYTQQIRHEIFSDPEAAYPYVRIQPARFNYGTEGSTADWIAYGNWQYKLLEGLNELPAVEKNTIDDLIRNKTDKREIVKTLYRYLQDHTRYINVSIGIGGFKPYPAAYVAENKYGDCKALTNYMMAMLSYTGIKSYYTIIYARNQPKTFLTDYIGPQFNHVVLTIPLGKDTIWLDNTEKNIPFAYCGTFIQNRPALLIDKDKSHLIRIPALGTEDCRNIKKLDFAIYNDRSAVVNARLTFRGENFSLFDHLSSDFSENSKDNIIKDYMPFRNYEVQAWDLNRPYRDSATIELSSRLLLYDFTKTLGQDLYTSIYPSTLPSFTPPASRTLPVNIPYPLCSADTLIYHFPENYSLKYMIEPVEVKSTAGTYQLTSKTTDHALIIVRRLDINAGEYALSKYPVLYDFIQKVKATENKAVVFSPKI